MSTFPAGLSVHMHTENQICPIKTSIKKLAARRFSCCSSAVWNNLPSFVRTADSFRSQLKTYMFTRHL